MGFWSQLPQARLLADVSLWSANLAALGDEVRRMQSYADMFHVDVTDTHFVPGLLFCPDLVAALRPITKRPFHVHLMVEDPASLFDAFVRAGADLITVHWEIGERLEPALQELRKIGIPAGIAVNLDTPIEVIKPLVQDVELVVVMGTALAIKGCGLHPDTSNRITKIRRLLSENGRQNLTRIEVDGGIRDHTVPSLRAAGADLVVPGSLAFQSDNPDIVFRWLRSLQVGAQHSSTGMS